MKLSGADIIIKALVDQGADTIFGYPGGAVLPFYDSLFKQNKLRHILVRHEQGAAHAAEGYARSTGKPGIIVVTSGPGATNTVTGLTDALLDSIPLICITGQVATHVIGSDAFQEADTVGITMPCCKHNYLAKDINSLEKIVNEAYHIATTGRPGPVVIDLPKDIQLMEIDYLGTFSDYHRPSYTKKHEVDLEAIEKAVEMISKAKQPIIYSGGGIINSGEKASKLLTEFAHLCNSPVTNTLMGLGAFPADDPQFVKMLGMHGSLEANMCMANCDVMLNIGARFDDRITGRTDEFSKGSKKIHIDIDASSVNKNISVDIPIIGDATVILEEMVSIWKKNKYKPNPELKKWWKQIDKWREVNSFSYKQKNNEPTKPQYVLDRLNNLKKGKDTFITTDVGQHQMWAAQFLEFNKPRRWMTSGGLGTMGYGLPAAIGAQIGNPDKLVICVSGESSVMMNIQELSTVYQYRLPLKLLILNNSYMGMVRQWQELMFGDRQSESYMDSLPDFVELAESFGIKGMRCDKPPDVDKALKEMIDYDGPVVMDMVVDKKENVFPMIPAGAAHYDIMLDAKTKVQDIDKTKAKSQV